jgi:hypothetical protein
MQYKGVRIGHKAEHTAFMVDEKVAKIFNWRDDKKKKTYWKTRV